MRRYTVKNLETGEVKIFIGGIEARTKAYALEMELERFDSASEPICPRCKQLLKRSLSEES